MKYLPLLIIAFLSLTSCDKSPIEQIKAVTEDKYPVANMPDEPLDKPLEIVREPKRLAMTTTWSAGVKDDGTLWTWGTDSLLRPAQTGQDPTPRPVEGIHDAVAVSGGGGHMLLLRKDGTVWGWGSNHDGEIDPSDKDTSIDELRQIKGIDNVVDIVAGTGASIFLTKTGEVYYQGKNEWHILKNTDEKIISKPTKIGGLENIEKFDGNSGYILAINNQGKLLTTHCIGDAKVVSISQQNTICNIEFDKKVADVAQGIASFALLEDGSVWSWGETRGCAAQGNTSTRLDNPKKVPNLSKVINISDFSANTSNGNVYIWGHYLIGESPEPSESSMKIIASPILIMKNTRVSFFVRNSYISAFINHKGEVWFWEGNRMGQRGTNAVIKTFHKDFVFTPEKSLFALN